MPDIGASLSNVVTAQQIDKATAAPLLRNIDTESQHDNATARNHRIILLRRQTRQPRSI